MLNSSLCDYSDKYTFAKQTITIAGTGGKRLQPKQIKVV